MAKRGRSPLYSRPHRSEEKVCAVFVENGHEIYLPQHATSLAKRGSNSLQRLSMSSFSRFHPSTLSALLLLAAAAVPLATQADVLYTADFENFTPGDDRVVGTDGWLGTTATTAAGKSGISPETGTTGHGVPGLGNAVFHGGNTTPVTFAGTNINLRKPLAYDPVANNKEITFITCFVGIKDSTVVPLTQTRRDDFEITFFNSSNVPIAALQFDNTTLNTQTQPPAPQQLIFRSNSTAGVGGFTYTSTGSYFLYDVMQVLSIRINWRTNKWTALLDDTLLFNDQPFYLGTNARNLGAVGFRMLFGSAVQISQTQFTCTGGTNYALYDDLTIQADPIGKPKVDTITKLANGNFRIQWPTEAGYTYTVFRGTTLNGNWTQLSSFTATSSASLNYTDTTNALLGAAFYRVSSAYP